MLRQHILNDWLVQVLKTPDFRCVPMQNDASLRRYYRIHVLEKTYILMDAPPPESCELFLNIASVLKQHKLSVPEVFASNLEQGFLLLSDLGDRLYLNELNVNSAQKLYQDAFQAIIQMQKIEHPLPKFDKAAQRQQLNELFKYWYLQVHLKREIQSAELSQLDQNLDLILDVIAEQPQVFIHRDYHSRNLMILDQQNPGILDFQDALLGGITYDLVSLLQDCYITWPRTNVENFVVEFQKQLVDEKLLSPEISKATFLRWFDFTGIQRHLKNLGIFTRKWHRDQNPNYLKDVPVPLNHVRESFERYPELKPLQAFFQTLRFEEQGSVT